MTILFSKVKKYCIGRGFVRWERGVIPAKKSFKKEEQKFE